MECCDLIWYLNMKFGIEIKNFCMDEPFFEWDYVALNVLLFEQSLWISIALNMLFNDDIINEFLYAFYTINLGFLSFDFYFVYLVIF